MSRMGVEELNMWQPFTVFDLPPVHSIHLMTSFSEFKDVSFKILEPIHHSVWCYIYVSLFVLTLSMFLVLLTYMKVEPSMCRLRSNDPTQVWLRIIGGITEAFSSKFFRFGIAGACLMLTFELLSYSMNTIYNANLRSYIIGEVAKFDPLNDISDLDSRHEKIIYTDLGLNYANSLTPLNYQQLQPKIQWCKHFQLLHHFYIIKNGKLFARTRNLELNKIQKEALCFIEAITMKKDFPAIVMSNSEYYQDYAGKFVGPNKPIPVNYLRKGKNVLFETFNGLTIRRYEVFEEEVYKAVQCIQVYINYLTNSIWFDNRFYLV